VCGQGTGAVREKIDGIEVMMEDNKDDIVDGSPCLTA
jgi:hypothetical protein